MCQTLILESNIVIQAWELHSVLDVERIMATAVTIPGQTELNLSSSSSSSSHDDDDDDGDGHDDDDDDD